jgi:hypothetical protein
MKSGSKIMFLIVWLVIQGCSAFAPYTRTIYVRDGDAVMLRKDIDNAEVWAMPCCWKDDSGGRLVLTVL